MNKYHRKRSKRIKKWMNILNAKGYNVTYRQTKRRMRRFDQIISKWNLARRYLNFPVCNELARHWDLDKPHNDGLNARMYIIDETPIVPGPAMWPKENPFVRRYTNNWYYKKEDKTNG